MKYKVTKFKLIKLTILLIFNFQFSFSQDKEFKYYKYNHVSFPRSDDFYNAGEYRKSIEYNLMKIDSIGSVVEPYSYVLAQNYALLGMADSAFYYLNFYVDGVPRDYRSVYIDQDFEILKKNEREWKRITGRIENIYLEELEPSMNKNLAVELFRMGIEDQEYGAFTPASCRRKATPNGIEIFEINKKRKKDLKKLIRKYGLPTPSMVGYTACRSAFYVLQHSRIEDKHYYLVKDAYNKGEYPAEFYALLTDRWLCQNGKNQLYGTQFTGKKNDDGKIENFILNPVDDFDNLNQRRAELGLTSVEEYATMVGGIIPEDYYSNEKE